ncbi:MAG: restriction endonuclease [Lachnospiraceae bacterium]|nr:restriction endonuclease [Lachnospiraceae bacterium]
MGSVDDDFVDFLIHVYEKEIEESGKKTPGRCFELFLEEAFKVAGYSVEDRPYVWDKGIEFIASKNNIAIVVQAKKLKINATDLVSVSEMRDFIVALNNYKLKTCLECGQVLMHKYSKRTRSEYWAHSEYNQPNCRNCKYTENME